MATMLEKCAKRRTTLPILPCDCAQCVWYISDINYNDCFWVLSEILNIHPGIRFTFEEIACMENIPVKEVLNLFESALKKIREQASNELSDGCEDF
jgi:hypothetical protein